MAKSKASKTAIASQSKPKPEKRKSQHVEREDQKLSPRAKRTKSSKNVPASSTPQYAPPVSHPHTDASKDVVPATAPSVVDDAWRQVFHVEEMNIITSSSIQKKASRAIDVIIDRGAQKSPAVVELHAKGPATAKMITVVEIAKRQIGLGEGKWFQYNKVQQVMAEREKKERKERAHKERGKEKDKGEVEEDDEEEDEEDGAFETMKTPFERANEARPKVRAVPIMTIYLSRTRIEVLRKAYGLVEGFLSLSSSLLTRDREQTNALEASKA